ncbi:hypothetical protein Tco_1342908, partial [Tanacetum coccineum]
MASDDNNQDAKYALSKLLQMGTVEDYQLEFEMLIKQVSIPESLLKSFYISGLKLDLQCLLLREDFFKARITKAHFDIIAKEDKEHIVEKKIDVILPLQGRFASPEVKGSLDADEYIGVDDVSSAIDGVFNIGKSNVESIEVRSKFGEFSKNKASLEEVVVGGGKVLGVGEDDDLCNAATYGGDDTIESGDISILNPLIGHGSPRSLQPCGRVSDDGFVEVTRKHGNGKQTAKTRRIDGVQLTKPKPNYYNRPISKSVNVNSEASSSIRLMVLWRKIKKIEVNNETWKASNNVGSIMDDSDSEEVENIFVEDNGKPMDDLVGDARKKVKASPKKTPRKTRI